MLLYSARAEYTGKVSNYRITNTSTSPYRYALVVYECEYYLYEVIVIWIIVVPQKWLSE